MGKPIITIIAAVGPERDKRIIGDGNRLPWHLPRDLRFFRRVTLNHTVVMGRKTFESFGRRPLPKRTNVIISRNQHYQAAGCQVFHSIEEAIDSLSDQEKIFIIGGGEIYRQAMQYADDIILTEIVDKNPNLNLFSLFKGTVYFPDIPASEWKQTRLGKKWYLATNQFPVRKEQNARQRALYFHVLEYKRIGR